MKTDSSGTPAASSSLAGQVRKTTRVIPGRHGVQIRHEEEPGPRARSAKGRSAPR
jgi:hypothetical protein